MKIVNDLLSLGIPELDEHGFQPRGRRGGMCFYGKGGGSSAPAPDPQIGASAMANVALGKEWLNFAKEQFAEGNVRQSATDALNTKVINQQLEGQAKANQRSDQQWSDYNTTYRPFEKMNAIDAMGGQNLTDDQVKELLGNQNQQEMSRLQAEHEANLAAIQAMGGGEGRTVKTAGLSQSAAQSLAESILGGYKSDASSSDPMAHAFDGYFSRIGASGLVSKDPQADYAARKADLIKQLTGLGGSESKILESMTPEQRQALIDAEKRRFASQSSGLTDVTDQVMAARQAERNAQTNAAAEAKADVLANSAVQKEMSMRQMASMGVRPDSGRFAGITRAQDTNTALAAAGAQNNARSIVRNRGLALRADQANYGRGGSSVAATQVGLGMNSGNSAVANNASGNQNFYQNQGVMNTGFNGAVGANNSAGSMLNSLYGNQLNAWSAQQQANATSASGLGSMIGTLGVGAMKYGPALMASDERLKFNIKKVGQLDNGINLYTYEFKPEFKDELGHGMQFGVLAQEVEKVIPQAVSEWRDGYKKVNYTKVLNHGI